ncbi:LacI family DNA-binding transcriptional regulator [uncultured Victivallis sp.]|uniref:LacI family DNA-binding transcriptional regulator n=1 Tax=uncultured Victivallis sp. TaxID=354118 RepID=UPI002582E967|nr:LacI family DNA-binding transcriptional regulator [uncultured Victivallis sp.]
MPERINQKEIARLANVCQAAVSAVLNPNARGNTKVSSEVRERILRIADEYNYRPNLQARILRGNGCSNLVGVLIDPQISLFFYDLLLPLEIELRKRHKRMLIGQIGDNPEETESLLRNFLDHNLDGVIAIHHDVRDSERIFRAFLPLLPQTVFLNHPEGMPDTRAVCIDYANGVREAVLHLAAGGRRRIALCMDDAERYLSMRMRADGYRQGLVQAGLPFDSGLMFIRRPGTGCTFEEVISDAVETLANRSGADAVIAGNDEWALALLKELNRRRISVPDRIALVGYGNVRNICRSTAPELTSIHHGTEEVACKLARALTDPAAAEQPVLSRLVIRESTV